MVQAQLIQEEYNALSKVYNTYNTQGRSNSEEVTPNSMMGDSLTPLEIRTINTRLDYVLRRAGLIP